jgi:hypothetical protein
MLAHTILAKNYKTVKPTRIPKYEFGVVSKRRFHQPFLLRVIVLRMWLLILSPACNTNRAKTTNTFSSDHFTNNLTFDFKLIPACNSNRAKPSKALFVE